MAYLDNNNTTPSLSALKIGEVRDVVKALAQLKISDLAPLDEEAMRHAQEHIDAGGLKGEAFGAEVDEEGMDRRRREGRAVVESVRARLKGMFESLGLNIEV